LAPLSENRGGPSSRSESLQDDPIGYAWLAISLYERGVGYLSRKVTAGYKVVLSIDDRLLYKAKQDSEALVATMNHFVGLTTPITFDGTGKYLTFEVFSWGKGAPSA
jgi:hypothetical protein